MKIIQFFASILLALGLLTAPVAEYTLFENRAYTNDELVVEPDESKFIKITASDTGKDIYKLTEGIDFGYRYGPTLLSNADGSIDAFFAAPGRFDEWDWISYRHSPDGGETWTVINDFGTNIPADADKNGTVTPNYEMFKNCKKSDAGFNLATDGKTVDQEYENESFEKRKDQHR